MCIGKSTGSVGSVCTLRHSLRVLERTCVVKGRLCAHCALTHLPFQKRRSTIQQSQSYFQIHSQLKSLEAKEYLKSWSSQVWLVSPLSSTSQSRFPLFSAHTLDDLVWLAGEGDRDLQPLRMWSQLTSFGFLPIWDIMGYKSIKKYARIFPEY